MTTTANTDTDTNADPSADMLDQILEVAIIASKKAGDIIIGNAGGAEITQRKANSRDLLTLIDPLCEKVNVLCLHYAPFVVHHCFAFLMIDVQ